jgi:general secretion pathway protein J
MRNKRGFTLLEILIALFVFTIVSIIMVSALHNISNTQSATEKQSARLDQLQLAMLILSRDIEQTINRPILNSQGAQDGPLIGTKNSITFTHAGLANPLGQLHRSTLQRARYSLKNDTLVRETWDVLDQTPDSQIHARNLLNAVSELHFEYLDDKGKFQTEWPTVGQSQIPLPRAVRVSLTIKKWGKLSQLYLISGQGLAKPP